MEHICQTCNDAVYVSPTSLIEGLKNEGNSNE